MKIWQKHKRLIIILSVPLVALGAVAGTIGGVLSNRFNATTSRSNNVSNNLPTPTDTSTPSSLPSPEVVPQPSSPGTDTTNPSLPNKEEYSYLNYKDKVQQKSISELQKDETIITQLLLQEWKPYLFKTKSGITYSLFDIATYSEKREDIDVVLDKISKYLWSWADNRRAMLTLAKSEIEKSQNRNFYPLYKLNFLNSNWFMLDGSNYFTPIVNLLNYFNAFPNLFRANYKNKLAEIVKTRNSISQEYKKNEQKIYFEKERKSFESKLQQEQKAIDSWLISFYNSIPDYNPSLYDYKNYQEQVKNKTIDELQKDEIIITQLLLEKWKPYLFKTHTRHTKSGLDAYTFFDVSLYPEKRGNLEIVLNEISKYLWSWADNRRAMLELVKKNQNLENLYQLSYSFFKYFQFNSSSYYFNPIIELINYFKAFAQLKNSKHKEKLAEIVSTEDSIDKMLKEHESALNEKRASFETRLQTSRKLHTNWLISFYFSLPYYKLSAIS